MAQEHRQLLFLTVITANSRYRSIWWCEYLHVRSICNCHLFIYNVLYSTIWRNPIRNRQCHYSLASFSATNCGLAGTIPSEIGNLVSMQQLALYQNKSTGTIRTRIGSMSVLAIRYMEGNMLLGAMPEEVCVVKNNAMLLQILGADCQVDSTDVDCACCTCCGPIGCSDLVC